MITALTLILSLLAADDGRVCRFEGAPRTWTAGALEAWDRLDRERLHTPRPVTPTLVLFDQDCAFTLTPDAGGRFAVGGRTWSVTGRPHDGTVALPGGGEVPARKLSFAFPGPDSGMNFVMALPAVWRADASETRDPDRLAMGVFMHEFAHTQQGEGLGRRIDDLIARGLSPDVDDDIVQKRFKEQADYVTAFGPERDLFYAATAAPDAVEARRRLAAAAALMAERRARWFTGEDALLASADDVFLTFEGSGNWAAWIWLTDPRGGGLSPGAASDFIRGGRSFWSQDEGLGIMLALERLTPDWPTRAFGPEGETADALIARALAVAP
jgi:hypothetical protein